MEVLPESFETAKKSLEGTLDTEMKTLGAHCCVLYIRDPWAPESVRLVCMPGVIYQEPMQGFVFPTSSLELVVGPPENLQDFYDDASTMGQPTPPIELRKKKYSRLYGNFVHRERIKSCARLKTPDSTVVLWVNYRKRTKFTREIKIQIISLFDRIQPAVRELEILLRSHRPLWIEKGSQFLRQMEALPTSEKSLSTYLDKLLATVFDVFTPPIGSIGTIHIYSHWERKIKLKASRGHIIESKTSELDVRDGLGIVCWVAQMKKALLVVAAPGKSRHKGFGKIFITIAKGMINELTVPIILNNALIGVINLESPIAHFTSEHTRALWYAADQAAIAIRFVQQAERNEDLLSIAREITGAPADQFIENGELGNYNPILDELAKMARDSVDADHCDIWYYDVEKKKFTTRGATYKQKRLTNPRENGWTHYIRKHSAPVLICDIISGRQRFKSLYWSTRDDRWTEQPYDGLGGLPPTTLHPRATKSGAEVGLPIIIQGNKCIGVAWIKFSRIGGSEIPLDSVNIAQGFVAEAGLVLDLFEGYRKRSNQQTLASKWSDALFAPGMIKELVALGIDGYAIREPYGDLGGDFFLYCDWTKPKPGSVDDGDGVKWGCLLGDGTDHGLIGAFSMLPILAAFIATSGVESAGAIPITELNRVCCNLKDRGMPLGGTVQFFMIALQEEIDQDRHIVKRVRKLYVAGAGHPPLVVISANGHSRDPEAQGSQQNIGTLGVKWSTQIVPAVYNLSVGDIIVAYTDGVTESRRLKETDDFGTHGLTGVATLHVKERPESIANAILDTARTHAGGAFHDDVTIIVLKVGELR